MDLDSIQFVDVSQFAKTKENSSFTSLKRKCYKVTKLEDGRAECTVSTPCVTTSFRSIEGSVGPRSIQQEILATLKLILNNQEILGARISKIESTIADNEKSLGDQLELIQLNQSLLSDNQNNLSDKLDKIVLNLADKQTVKTQTKLLRECKDEMQKIEQTFSRISGEVNDEEMDEISSTLPLQSIADVEYVEDKLKISEYAQAMTAYVKKLKGPTEDVSTVIRYIFTDDVLVKYNWDGRWEKFALNKLYMVDSILRDAFRNQGAHGFEKSLRKSIERSHHRAGQKKYWERKSKGNTFS